ncbi:MAG: hypothetical protein OEW75_11805 [Cyclobacteriaceae bacterium]|nr:hypothetical protein [Cyclobacteriaceae bacterium]
MSTGIGFAGLGKYLNDRGLSLLKGRKSRSVTHSRDDHRQLPDNSTDYIELTDFQQIQRDKTNRMRKIIFLSILILSIFGIILVKSIF